MSTPRITSLALGLLLFAACSESSDTLIGPASSPVASISDGAHTGNTNFFFLPPMVSDPGDLAAGTFDPSLSPEVQICIWNPVDGECGANLDMYTTDTGPGSETVRLNETDELYIVNWHTDDILENFPLDTDEVYRIRVLVEGKELGFADVVVVSSGNELKNVDTDEYIPLKDGRTLPIKFRIEEGALAQAYPVSAGGYHSCAITADGDAYCWGDNKYGQLGIGSTVPRPSPKAVVGGHTFVSVSTGLYHTCGLTAAGAAYCWGYGRYGQLGLGHTKTAISPVAVVGGYTFASVSAGDYHTCAVTTVGDAYCWGFNKHGQIGNGTYGYSELSPVAVVGAYTFAALSAGAYHTCGLTTNGDGYCWGYNQYGQIGNGTHGFGEASPVPVVGGHTFASVSGGGVHTCGLTTNGDGYCWGYNKHGELGNGTMSVSEPSPVAVFGGHMFASLSAGGYHSCGLATNGDGYCWGYNQYGQLGNGTTSSSLSPVAVVGGHTFASLNAGERHTCGAIPEGDAYCWGYNQYGQVGNGTTSLSEPSPEFAMDLDPLPKP